MAAHSRQFVRDHMPPRVDGLRAQFQRLPAMRERIPAMRERMPAIRDRVIAAAESPKAQQAKARVAARATAGVQTAQRSAQATARATKSAAAKVPRRGRGILMVVGAFALGAMLAYFLDSHSGRRRRALVRDKIAHNRRVIRRDVPRVAQKRLRFLGGLAKGMGHNAADLVPHHLRRGAVDDETLVARVRSEALRGDGIKSGEIHVDAYEGCVTLRGQLEHPDEIRRIVVATGRIDGVVEVRSYLHLPGTPPPNKAEALVNGHMRESIPH
jgi:osmotically-inducible protein OsmY